MSSEQKMRMIEDILSSRCLIGEKNQLKKQKKEFEKHTEKLDSHDEAIDFLSTIPIETKYDKVISIIEDVFHTTLKRVSDNDKEILLNAIKSRSALRELI